MIGSLVRGMFLTNDSGTYFFPSGPYRRGYLLADPGVASVLSRRVKAFYLGGAVGIVTAAALEEPADRIAVPIVCAAVIALYWSVVVRPVVRSAADSIRLTRKEARLYAGRTISWTEVAILLMLGGGLLAYSGSILIDAWFLWPVALARIIHGDSGMRQADLLRVGFPTSKVDERSRGCRGVSFNGYNPVENVILFARTDRW